MLALGGLLYIKTRPTPVAQTTALNLQTEPPVTNTPTNTNQTNPTEHTTTESTIINDQTKPEVMGKQTKLYNAPPKMQIDPQKIYTAVIETSKGNMTIEMDPSETPNTVNNFVFLAKEGFYDNTIFHRIISGFMIQGGDPNGDGTGGPGYKFDDEPITKPYTRGTIAMANSGPNTNGSQFFIMHKDYQLPPNYVIFGQINPQDKQSMDTLDAIAATPVTQNMFGEKSTPTEKVTINSITITESE